MGTLSAASGRKYNHILGALLAGSCLAMAAPLLISSHAFAGELQVSPINIEVPAATQATTESLTNMGKTPINAQVRAYKWVIRDGQDKLEPTTDVVASPPALKIPPGGKATIRIVRLTKAPIAGEETYRLLIDDIPPPPTAGADSVSFAVRHNIPVFFQAGGIHSKLVWTATLNGGVLELHAKNDGELHARLAQLAVTVNGATTNYNNGLAGYVLGGNATSWKMKLKGLGAGNPIKITASSNDGPVDTTVQVQ